MYKRISDYGIIGNSQTVALVGNDGSIDWLCLLNAGASQHRPAMADIVKDLKHLTNTLSRAYFRMAEGRIAYEEMAESRVYREYVKCTRYLHHFDLGSLKTREEQLAFWIMEVLGVAART